MILVISLKAGELIRYTGGKNVIVLDPVLHEIKTIAIDPAQFKIAKGSHSIVFDCNFANKAKEPTAKFEVRIPGKAEEIGK